MAVNYWDYWSHQSTTGTSSTNDWTTYDGTAATDTTTWCYTTTVQVIHRYLVRCPESWADDELAAFTHLINDEINTGFKVNLIIRGDIRITDPSIDIRTMVEFVPLLKSCATERDRAKVDAFFEAHSPVDEEAGE